MDASSVLVRWLNSGELPDDAQAWHKLINEAKFSGLAPLLARAMAETKKAQPPEDARQELQELLAKTAATNLLLAEELVAILRAAQARGLACAPLRGVALSEQLHGDITLRPTGDVDVLVKREQLPDVRRLFSELGYREVEPRAGFADAFEYTLEYFKDGPIGLIAEPHLTIAYPPFSNQLDMAGVWSRSTQATVLGVSCSALSIEDALIHLCLHWLHHQKDAPLLWLYEINLLIRKQHINWMLMVEIASAAGVAALIGRVLGTVTELFQTPLPEQALHNLQEAALGGDARITTLLSQKPQVRGRERLALFLTLPGLRAKLRYAAGFLFPSAEFIREQYGITGKWRIGLTYLRRVAGLMWDGARGLLHLWTVP